MGILDLADYVKQQAHARRIAIAELARRSSISRVALLKILNGTVRHPEIVTLANLAYALDDHPYHLFSLFLAGTNVPSRSEWRTGQKRDSSRFIRDITIPSGSQVLTQAVFRKIWAIANTGEQFWVGRKLVCLDHQEKLFRRDGSDYAEVIHFLIPSANEIVIPPTPPGATTEIAVDFLAPDAPAWVVSYWKMVDRDGKDCLPELGRLFCSVNVVVV